MKSDKKLTEILWELFREVYKNAEPSVDFDKLLEESPKNEEGKTLFPFEDYTISPEKEDEIIDKIKKKYNLTKREWKKISFTYYLTISPKYEI